MIRCNLDLLRVNKERAEDRRLPYRVIGQETGLSPSTLVRLMNNDFDRVDRGTLDTLCGFFDCGIGDLLEYVPGSKAEKERTEAGQ